MDNLTAKKKSLLDAEIQKVGLEEYLKGKTGVFLDLYALIGDFHKDGSMQHAKEVCDHHKNAQATLNEIKYLFCDEN